MTVEPAICDGCGADTTPCTGRRGCRHKGRWEYYAGHDGVWEAARPWTAEGGRVRYLCVACLERRLGRTLRPDDFRDVPINDPDDPWHTPRLASRLGRLQ